MGLLFLSDAAQVSPDGKLQVIGGGLSWIARPLAASADQAASPSSFAIVCSFRIGWNDTNTEFPMRITVGGLDEATDLVEVTANVIAGRPPQLSGGDAVSIQLAMPVLANFPKAGHYVVRAALKYYDEEKDKSVRFSVVDVPIPPRATPAR